MSSQEIDRRRAGSTRYEPITPEKAKVNSTPFPCRCLSAGRIAAARCGARALAHFFHMRLRSDACGVADANGGECAYGPPIVPARIPDVSPPVGHTASKPRSVVARAGYVAGPSDE